MKNRISQHRVKKLLTRIEMICVLEKLFYAGIKDNSDICC